MGARPRGPVLVFLDANVLVAASVPPQPGPGAGGSAGPRHDESARLLAALAARPGSGATAPTAVYEAGAALGAVARARARRAPDGRSAEDLAAEWRANLQGHLPAAPPVAPSGAAVAAAAAVADRMVADLEAADPEDPQLSRLRGKGRAGDMRMLAEAAAGRRARGGPALLASYDAGLSPPGQGSPAPVTDAIRRRLGITCGTPAALMDGPLRRAGWGAGGPEPSSP